MSQPHPASTFLLEAEDLLAQIETTALEVHPGEPAGERIHRLFRAFHTIKGSGAMFGFEAVAQFTHHVETVLDQVREGVLPVSAELVELILSAKDQISRLLVAEQQGCAPAGDGADIIAALRALASPAGQAADPSPAPLTTAALPPASGSPTEPAQAFRIWFRPAPGLMASGTNPALLLDELRALGKCQAVAKTEAIPALDQLLPDRCYLAWDIHLVTDKGLNAIKDVFIFVEDESELKIEPVAATSRDLGPVLPVSVGQVEPGRGEAPTPPEPSVPPKPSGSGSESTTDRRPALGPKPGVRDATVRVPSERLDRLVQLVGELVMNQSRLSQVAAAIHESNLAAPVEELERLVAELRDNVLGIRMMPIGTTFGRFKRLVHDLSAELGKEIELVTEGAETELDKTVLDQLGDPLVHLIRNSIDHGIEPMEARLQAGKPRQGTIRLAAAHTGSNVVLTIQDDGRGLDPAAIRAKAIEKQLIAPEAALTREELYNLVFRPGFSTARQVTSVSGRGVGMDVVKRQMETLRAAIQLTSEPGQGTTVSLTLPLTLAIIDGLLVEIGQDRFIIPMAAVAENVELTRVQRARCNGRNLIAVRGELVPYLRLREEFAMNGEEAETEKVVIVRHGSERVGLVVDRVLGSHQTVIQSLGRFFRQIEVVSGATIMGDGRVALILDLAGVLRRCGREGAAEAVQAPGRPTEPRL